MAFQVSGELTFPILPGRDLDESIAFYELRGFERTYRQLRPNPYGVVALDDLQIDLSGIEGLIPEDSYASVIVVVPDADALYASFASRLRIALGKLPSAGIPRIVRPRKRPGQGPRGWDGLLEGWHGGECGDPDTGLCAVRDALPARSGFLSSG
jgi:hypothetical protein